MQKTCEICEEKKQPLFEFNFSCKHQKQICCDCLSDFDINNKCPDCQFIKCTFCNKKQYDAEQYQITTFKNCQDENHEVILCQECYVQKNINLTNEEYKKCFLCWTDMEKNKLIYYTQKLDCNQHTVKLCSQCYDIFEMKKRKCPVCEKLNVKKKYCLTCFTEIDFELKINPILCHTKNHQFLICMDCIGNIKKPKIVCRICQNQQQNHFVFMDKISNEYSSIIFRGLKFISNSVNKQTIDFDPWNCPYCIPLQIVDFEIENQDEEDVQINQFCDGINLEQNLIFLSGGIDQDSLSTKNVYRIEFFKDGRKIDMKFSQLKNLKQARHSHKSFKQENDIYLIGGIIKIKKNEIQYLDSIEKYNILNQESQLIKMKLKKPRGQYELQFNNNKLYLIGGISQLNTLENSIEILDLDQQQSELLNLQIQIPLFISSFNQENKIIFYGGQLQGNNNDVFEIEDKNVKKIKNINSNTYNNFNYKMNNEIILFGFQKNNEKQEIIFQKYEQMKQFCNLDIENQKNCYFNGIPFEVNQQNLIYYSQKNIYQNLSKN